MTLLDEGNGPAIQTIQNRGWTIPRPDPLLRKAVINYALLHSSRTRSCSGSFAATWEAVRIQVKNHAEAEFLIRTWDHIYDLEQELMQRRHNSA